METDFDASAVALPISVFLQTLNRSGIIQLNHLSPSSNLTDRKHNATLCSISKPNPVMIKIVTVIIFIIYA